MSRAEIEELIRAYRTRLFEVADVLGRHFDVAPDQLLAAKNRREIPSSGDASGLEFRFHGVGLWVGASSGRAVDFDWGPNGELGGFDAWRLHNFAMTNKPFKQRKADAYSGETIDRALESLHEQGLVEKRGPGLGDHLFFPTATFEC